MGTLWGREPAMILAAVQALLALGIGFGLHLTAEQTSLILAATAALLGLVVRRQVTAPATLSADYVPKAVAILDGYQPRHDRD